MQSQIFKGIPPPKNYGQAAGLRDGAMAILIGVAARKSIDEKRPVKVAELSDLVPQARRPV